jgi:hypothetical protein
MSSSSAPTARATAFDLQLAFIEPVQIDQEMRTDTPFRMAPPALIRAR